MIGTALTNVLSAKQQKLIVWFIWCHPVDTYLETELLFRI